MTAEQDWYRVGDDALVDLNEVAMVELMLGHEGWPVRLTLRSGRYVDHPTGAYEKAVELLAYLETRLACG